MIRTMMMLLLLVWLVGCSAPAEPEPAALDETAAAESGPPDAPSGALSPVTAEPADDSAETPAPTEAEEPAAMPDDPDDEIEETETSADTASGDDPVTSQSVAPVVVDLSKITPSAPADAGTPRVMPAPGVPVRVPVDKQSLVDAMRADLLTRAKVDPDRLRVIYFQAVTWPDGSLGCPQPGMAYTMALVDGYQVIFADADGREYFYHSAGDAQFVYCANGQRFVSGDS